MRPSFNELIQPGLQSVFRTAGPHAEAVAELAWLMIVAGALIFGSVLALAAYAVWGPADRRGGARTNVS